MGKLSSIFGGIVLITILSAIQPFTVDARQKIVLFDEGHGQRFLVERNGGHDLSGLSELFQKNGLQVSTSKEEVTEKALAEVDALVISGAFAPFKASEVSTIINFIKNGGRLCVMLHIGSPFAGLLSKLNVYVSKGVVREEENLIQQKKTNYYVTTLSEHELVKDIERFKVFGGWALITDNEHAKTLAQTSAKAWIDKNMNNRKDTGEKQRPLGLAIASGLGDGNFVVFGDDAIFQNRFLSEENIQLGKNLARWLAGGTLTPASNQVYL